MNLISPEEATRRFRVLCKGTVEHMFLPDYRKSEGGTLPGIVLLSPPNFRPGKVLEWEAAEELLGFHWFLTIRTRTEDEETESRILLCLLDGSQRREASSIVAASAGSDGRFASSKVEAWLLWRMGGQLIGLVDPIRFSVRGLAIALLARALGPEEGSPFFASLRMTDCPRCREGER
jgi:hypothetical protein